MRKWWLFFPVLVLGVGMLQGCKKNVSEENYTPIVNPVKPDLTTQVNASVNGFVTDENGDALQGATITAGSSTITTDTYGYFKTTTTAFAKSAGFIKASKAGYFTGYRTFLPVEEKETFIRLQLVPKTNTGFIESVAGGTVSTVDGATVTLPANAVVLASNNTAYTGLVNIATHWLNPAEINKTNLTMPGNLTGIDSSGNFNSLVTYGMMAVELTSENGALLQMAAGQKASLRFPLPASLQSTAPATIPLWYFDESNGLWKQEGHAIKNGDSYDGEVAHFSWWNCDAPYSLVNLQAQITNNNLQPLANVPVSVSINGQPNSGRVMQSDADGFVRGVVPANSNLTISILVPCGESVVVNNIVTANSDVDLGAITANLQQYGIAISGTVKKCNGTPVTNGYVVVTGIGGNAIINVTNGSFNASGATCPGTDAAIIAFDRQPVQQSSVQNIVLQSGGNDIGELTACTAPTTEIITVDDGATNPVFTLPQYLFGGNFYFANDSTSINAIDLLNSNRLVLQFSFTGSAATGSYPLFNNSFQLNGTYWQFVSPTTVTVNSYGLLGEFITGNFSGTATTCCPSATRAFTINFSIKRDQ